MQRFTKAMFESKFPSDDACLDFLLKARWPNGIECVKCQKVTKHYRIRAKKAYGCEFCGTLVSPTADTIFHKSATPLRDWFYAMFLMASTRTGVSAKHLERELGVTYKTAWRMFTQIRQSYLDSYTFRYNRRNAQQPMFLALLDRAPSSAR